MNQRIIILRRAYLPIYSYTTNTIYENQRMISFQDVLAKVKRKIVHSKLDKGFQLMDVAVEFVNYFLQRNPCSIQL